MVHNPETGKILREKRESAGYSHADVAKHLETTVSSYCDFEGYPEELSIFQPLGTIFELGDFLQFDCLSLFDFSSDCGFALKENEAINECIKAARLRRGYTLKRVSDDVGFEESIFEQIENDPEAVFYVIATGDLETLCSVLGLSFSSIITCAKSKWPTSETKLNRKWSRYWSAPVFPSSLSNSKCEDV